MALDKRSKKRRAKEYAAHSKKIGRVLKRFTPIDPTDQYSMGDDYDDALPRIVSLLLRDPNRNDLLEILEHARRDFDAPPDTAKDEQIADAVLKSFKTGAMPPIPKPAFRLDLRHDLTQIESYILGRVQNFDPTTNHGPGQSNFVGQIVIAFECSQSGWVALVFDTRPSPKPDGEWTRYLDDSLMFARENWAKACAANFRRPLAIIDTQGNEQCYPEEEAELTEHCGNLIRDLVMDIRKHDLFSDLPVTPNCEILIEDFDGHYSWPDCESPRVKPIR